jgi:uncharacterized membrane protein
LAAILEKLEQAAGSIAGGELMAADIEAAVRVEIYLRILRKHLRGIDREEVDEIVEELRTHIMEKATTATGLTVSTVNSTLASLGDPRQLAGQYLAGLLAETPLSRSPLRMLSILFRWASLSVAGIVVFLSALVGYLAGGALLLCALLKAIHPHTAGIWATRDVAGDLSISVRLGFGTAPVGAKEILGWWIIPIGLLVGAGLVMFTTKSTRWCVRRFPRKLQSSNTPEAI